jgi:3-oxosteroid 1-dehydrogenase
MGGAMYGRLFQQAVQRGIEFRSNVRVVRLVEDQGHVSGAEVIIGDKIQTFRARRGVLLNTGGFSLNRAMRQTYQHEPASIEWTLSNPGDTGEMIQMVQGMGAAIDLMDASWWVPGTTLPDGTRVYLVPELQQPHGFVVDSSGQRYMNEATSYVTIGNLMYERQRTFPAVPSWLIMDRQYMEKYQILGMSMKTIPKAWLDTGLIVEAATLTELAGKCAVPSESLAASVKRFNQIARSGVDSDFGRGKSAYHRLFGDPLHKPTPGLGAVDKAPFYAMKIYPGDVGTCGGLVTDEYARVVKTNGTTFRGLYAAGNCTATMMGHSYPGPGASIAPSLTFGYIAAMHALKTDSRSQ